MAESRDSLPADDTNADGDPAAEEIERFPKTVGRCNKGRVEGATPKRIFEGVDLESESQ
jgi:hypothetical protein